MIIATARFSPLARNSAKVNVASQAAARIASAPHATITIRVGAMEIPVKTCADLGPQSSEIARLPEWPAAKKEGEQPTAREQFPSVRIERADQGLESWSAMELNLAGERGFWLTIGRCLATILIG